MYKELSDFQSRPETERAVLWGKSLEVAYGWSKQRLKPLWIFENLQSTWKTSTLVSATCRVTRNFSLDILKFAVPDLHFVFY